LCLIAFHSLVHFFFHYNLCVFGNMATFHIVGRSELTIMVNNSKTTSMFEQCLCVMFSFQLGSLHISKDVSYDSNNLVLNLVYQIPLTSFQRR
jgi:Na+/H+ antiporter NhaA